MKSAGLKSKRVIERPMLSNRHQRLRLAWCLAWCCLNLRTWRRIYLSDESWFDKLCSCNRWANESLETEKYGVFPKEHPANCLLRWRLSNDMGMYLSWLQVELGHHTRKSNRWSVHLRCLANSCCSPIRQPPTSWKTYVYRWQSQAASFKGSNWLPSKWNLDFFSMVSHEPRFESDRACLGHARLSCTGSWTSCTKLTTIGSSISSGMVATSTAAHPTTDWRDEMEDTRYWTLNHGSGCR